MSRVSNNVSNSTQFDASRGRLNHNEARKARQVSYQAQRDDKRLFGNFSYSSLPSIKTATLVPSSKPVMVEVVTPTKSSEGSICSEASDLASLKAPTALHAALAQARRYYTATVTVASNTLNKVISFFAGVIQKVRPFLSKETKLRARPRN